MGQHEVKKSRKCRNCGHEIYGDAAKMKEHEDDHKLVDRAAVHGLVLPETEIVLPNSHAFISQDGRVVIIT